MFVRSLALGAMAALSLVTVANAEGWTGYYVGVNAGQGWSESEAERTIGGTGYFASTSIAAIQDASAMTLEEETFTGGAQFGVNVPVAEGVLIGFEVDAQGVGNEGLGTATVTYPCCGPSTFTTTNSVEQTWFGTARARVGFATERFMIFATGGYAGGQTKLTQTFSDTFSPIATEAVSHSEFLSGYSLGFGIEFMIESGASVKFEYLHIDLGEIDAAGTIAVATRTSDGRADVTDRYLRLGVNFQMD
jgi:outer membrane immunogenic protein